MRSSGRARAGSRPYRQPAWRAEPALRRLSHNYVMETDPKTPGVRSQPPNELPAIRPAPERRLHGMSFEPGILDRADAVLGVPCRSAPATVRLRLSELSYGSRLESGGVGDSATQQPVSANRSTRSGHLRRLPPRGGVRSLHRPEYPVRRLPPHGLSARQAGEPRVGEFSAHLRNMSWNGRLD